MIIYTPTQAATAPAAPVAAGTSPVAPGAASPSALSATPAARASFLPFTPGQAFTPPPAPATPTPPTSTFTPNIISKAANLFLGGASDLGVHLAQGAASLTAKAAGALGFKGEQAKIESNLQKPSTNMFGAPVPALEGGAAGAEQIGGDLLKSVAEAGAALAAPETLGSMAIAGGAIGAATGAGDAMQNVSSLADVAKRAGIGAVAGAITGFAASGVGQLLGKVGNWGIQSLIKPSKADIADGFSLDTIKKFNLGGTLYQMQDKAQNAMNDLTTQLRTKLASSNSTIDLTDVYNQTVKDILTGASKLKSFGANTRIQGALQQLQNEVGAVSEDGPLSIPDAQVIKQAAGQFGAWQYGKVDPDAKASEMVYNAFYNRLKTAIEQNSPAGVEEINQQLSRLIPVSNAIVRRVPVFERQSPLSLTDFIGLTASTFEPHALGLTLLNFLSKNGMVANQLMQHAATAGNVLSPYASFLSAKLGSTVSSPTSSQPQ